MILYRQVLMGDVSDNVPGLPRVGETTAFKAIQNWETAEEDARRFYEDTVRMKLHGVDHSIYFTEQLSLIQMLTDIPLEYKNTITITPDSGGFVSQEGGIVEQTATATPKGL